MTEKTATPPEGTVGALIRRRRMILGIDQQTAADKLGVSKNAVGFWESNRRIPRISKFARLREFLELSAEALAEAITTTERLRS